MDGVGWLAAAAGAAVGVGTGLVPGLHVNTVCAVFLVLAPSAGSHGVVLLAAAGTAHAFASILPATYLGSPGEETLASALPAHRMLHEGKGPEAVRVGVLATLAGLAAGTLVLLPYKWLMLQPIGLLAWVDRHMAPVLGGLVLFLVAREARDGWRRAAGAALLLLLSGLLGWIAMGWNVAALVAVPATPLLPLLSGLFGAPALLEGLRKPAAVPPQEPAPPAVPRMRVPLASGLAASAATAILPGMSSSVAVALARVGQRTQDPRPVLATQAVIAAAHLVLSFAVLWMSLSSRTGLAVAVQTLQPVPAWGSGAPPPQLFAVLQACLVGGLLAAAATLGLDRLAAKWVGNLPGRALGAGALVAVVALVVLLSGPMGLVLFAAATAVGGLPLVTGLGRLHLTGALLLPVLALRLGLG